MKPREFYCRFENDFSAEVLSGGPYHVPSARNYASIDSFFYPKQSSTSSTIDSGPLLLFQITVAQTHPVNGDGLANTLNQLGLLQSVKNDPAMAALIFVLPEKNIAKFGPQEIELDMSTDEDSVGKMNQIGKKREGALNTARIATIGDLRARLVAEETKKAKIADKLSLQTLRRLLSQHDEKHHWSGLKSTFDSIPQFVWKANLDPKYMADTKSGP
ncbi:hypothetical protein PHYPSEUDO_013128 [Phytophthora pseudosyringae]|uniref:Uncharacterized protein n=1 Tax=Phytophthora pseudosyringae TaxID=221518 RepID=A0A8T1V6C2_9STRA|nr:hypothetical protein PHYPSEUDO_013128 [Phytophthora pseudosyringae]